MVRELPLERAPPLFEGEPYEFVRLREELLNELFELLEGALLERDELFRFRDGLSGCIHPRERRDCFGDT